MNDEMFNTAQLRLDQANERYREAKNDGTILSILLIALSARNLLDPQVKYVVLDYSDQGDFLTLHDAWDAEENPLYEYGYGEDTDDPRTQQWETFSDEADSAYAWNLGRDDSYAWGDYLTQIDAERERLEPYRGAFMIDVDDVIAKIGAKLR